MMANNKLVGFGKIPVEEVFFSGNDAFCGIWCGKIRTIPIKWLNITDQNNRKEEFPAVLHVRMWFGRQSDIWAWKQCIQPAEMKAYLEIFSHQKKSKLQSWKAFEPELSDEKGIENMKDMTIMQLYGWNYLV
uniref:FerB domain-containing protein n=1 Tax=Heterorhabditis bacteriophora TaxID=37862 RepID=A0A1I7XNS1_HETBA